MVQCQGSEFQNGFCQKRNKTRQHSSRMHPVHLSTIEVGLPTETPGQRPTWTKILPEKDPPGQRPPDRDPPGQRPPGQRPPWRETPLDRDPLEGIWKQAQRPPKETQNQAARQEVTSYRDPCKQNHTHFWKYYLPQTSFVDGNNESSVLKYLLHV